MYNGVIEAGMRISYRLSDWRKPRELWIAKVDRDIVIGVPTKEDVAALVKEFPATANLAAKGVLGEEIRVQREGILRVLPKKRVIEKTD
jgi:hypothetical protein